jgi:hypothetical protein
MSQTKNIPLYAADGRSLGFRNEEAARRLVAAGHVSPSYGRKGHLRAIWLRGENGTSAIQGHIPSGAKYSFRQQLDNGRCWTLRRLDRRDDNGVMVNTRGLFLNVIAECMAQ